MLIYLFVLFSCVFLFLLNKGNSISRYSEKNITNIAFVLLGIFLCLGYTTGTDWRVYENIYGWQSLIDGNYVILLIYEAGFVLYMSIFQLLGIDFYHFLIITKIICFVAMTSTFRYYCPTNTLFLALLFFLSWYAFFLFIDNPLRNLISVSIFCLSLKYLREKKLKKYLLMTLFAISFHFSAIIMLLLYYIANKKIKTSTFVILYISFNILLLNSAIIFNILSSIFSSIPIVGSKIAAYSSPDSVHSIGKIISFGLVIHMALFTLLMMGRKKIESQNNGNLIFNFAAVFAIIFRLGLTILVMGRFQLYIAVFYSIAIGMLYYAFEKRSRMLYLCLIVIFSIIPCLSYLTKDYRYIPYTNYLFYIGNEMGSEEKSSYNMLNSPYTNSDTN